MAYLGPLPYVLLKQRHDFVEPLVFFNEPDGEPFYSCAIVAWNPLGVSLERISSRRAFALTSPLSTCGVLSVEAMLTRSNQSLREHTSKFLGKHDAVALSVVRGEFDYGGVKESIGRAYAHLGLEVIALTPPLPGFALVVNTQKLSQAKQNTLKKALLGASKEAMKQWGGSISHGTIEAHDEDYQRVRGLLRDTSFWNLTP
jgi:phosphonate transport system substrate-binding protein